MYIFVCIYIHVFIDQNTLLACVLINTHGNKIYIKYLPKIFRYTHIHINTMCRTQGHIYKAVHRSEHMVTPIPKKWTHSCMRLHVAHALLLMNMHMYISAFKAGFGFTCSLC